MSVKRLKGRPVTKEVFTAIKDMIAEGNRSQRQIGLLWGYSENTIYIINRFDEYEEYKDYSNRKNNRRNRESKEPEQIEMDTVTEEDKLQKYYQMNRIYKELEKQNALMQNIMDRLDKMITIWSN